MFPFIKLLKIVLPVTTVTAATIATVSLVSFQKTDNKLDKEAEDRVLEDFEKPTEDFKEQKMLYAKDGQGNNVSIKDEKQRQQLLEELAKNNGNLKQFEGEPEELKDKGSNNPSEGQSLENSDVDVPAGADLEDKPSGEGQLNEKDQINLQLPKESQGSSINGSDSDDAEHTPDSEESKQDSGGDGQELQSSGPELVKESVGNDDGEPEVDTKSEESNQEKSKMNDQDISDGNPDAKVEEDASTKDNLSSQENEKGPEDNTVPKADVDHQREPKTDNFGEGATGALNGDEKGVLNESGTEDMTKERLDELIKLGESASDALGSLQRLLLG